MTHWLSVAGLTDAGQQRELNEDLFYYRVVQASDEGPLGLFVVADGRARFTALPAAQAGRPSAVALPDAATIVVEGQYGLNDGDSVTLLDD